MPGLIDRTPEGRLALTGKDRSAFLHQYTTQDIQNLRPGQVRPAVIPTWKGTIQDWVRVAAAEQALLVSLSPGREADLMAFFDKYSLYDDLHIRSLTSETACLELVGLGAAEMAQDMWGPLALGECRFDGLNRLWTCDEGIEGAVFRIWLPIREREAVVTTLQQAGARLWSDEETENARVQWGVPAHGRELTEQINPWEARLGEAVSLTKGCYLGQEVIARLDSYDKVKQYLVGLRFGDSAPGGGEIEADGTRVGWITSAAGGVALGYVKTAFAQPGQELQVAGHAAQVVDLPFWAGKVVGKKALSSSPTSPS